MPAMEPWFERKFDFSFSADRYPSIVERLRGTPVRTRERVRLIGADELTRRKDDTWSVQENVGHLLDLEPLWLGRVDDILTAVETMRSADLTNRATHDARHNEESIDRLLSSFRTAREKLVARLDGLDREAFRRAAMHPRLQQPMRLVDLCLFVAEHDDYHLARITELHRMLRD